MSGPAAEFSRRVALSRIGATPLCLRIVANANECRGLARRFDLVVLDRLTAEVSLHRRNDGLILLEAAVEAEFEQACVVSLEPVRGAIARRFALLYGLPEAAPSEPESAEDDPVFEPLTGDAIDIGEAVAQEVSLALPEFPRDPEAQLDASAAEPEMGPLAGLAAWRRRPPE